MSEGYILDLGRREDLPCGCRVSLFAASLIRQEWIVSPGHLPATLCRCGKYYYSWSKGGAFATEKGGTP